MPELFPICRSITGDGRPGDTGGRRAAHSARAPRGAERHEVLDWTVPDEWNIRDAYIARDGRRIVDFRMSNLHLVSYSEPFARTLSLAELRPHLHSLPEHRDVDSVPNVVLHADLGVLLSQEQLDGLVEADVRGGGRQHARARLADLRRVFPAWAASRTRCC